MAVKFPDEKENHNKAMWRGGGIFDLISQFRFFKLTEHPKSILKMIANSDPVTITEGQASIQFENQSAVFYNPVQEYNRDISIAVIKLFTKKFLEEKSKSSKNINSPEAKKIRVLEAFSASGLRSIRYAQEIEGLTEIVANDISQKAVDAIKKNVSFNKVDDVVTPSHQDASLAMYMNRQTKDRFEIIDLDPYGSAAMFLDAAVQSVVDGGLLCVTCTDMAVLCGNVPETCRTKYGSIGLKSKCCHEMALRILLCCIETHANKYGRYVKPLLSLSIDFYCRVFVTVHTGRKECKLSASKMGYAYQCTGCESITPQRLMRAIPHENGKNMIHKLQGGPAVGKECKFCGKSHQMGGPFYLDPIHDHVFVDDLIKSLESDENYGTYDRMRGMLTVVSEELHDIPFYYTQDRLYSISKLHSMKTVQLRSAILNAGYRVSLSHANKNAIKTDAPNEFIWDVMRTWENLSPRAKELKSHNEVTNALMSKPPTASVSFSLHPDANPESRVKQLKRFQPNPERNWGPKSKAKAGCFEDSEKQKKNQGKKRKPEVENKIPDAKTSRAEESVTN